MLDLCCGPGRHVAPLMESGHRVIGLDRDAYSLGTARLMAPAAVLVRGDMRSLPIRDESLDAAICMWQSFGHFDSAGNRSALVETHRVLRPGGVMVLDLYHREYYASATGCRTIERDGRRIQERRTMFGNRLHVSLRYEHPDGGDEFDWLLYTPAELEEVARSVGYHHVLTCTEFDEHTPASADRPRMQLVFRA
jgi:SAM-dependent methyltransferase